MVAHCPGLPDEHESVSLAVYFGLLATAIGFGAIIARGFRPRRWPLTAVMAVIAGLYGHLALVEWASWCAVAAVAIGFIVPSVLAAKTQRAALRGDFRSAAWWAQRVGYFRSTWRPFSRIFSVSAEYAEGNTAPAEVLIAELAASDDPQNLALRDTVLALTNRWEQARFALSLDVQARALCELGEVERGIETMGPLWPRRMGWAAIRRSRGAMIGPLAFGGEVTTVDTLCRLLRLAPGPTVYWRSTALAASGQREAALETLDLLDGMETTPSVRERAAHRRAHLPVPVELSSSARAVLDSAALEIRAGFLIRAEAFWRRPAVTVIMGLLMGGFILQIVRGGTEDPFVALSLGAILADGQLPQEPWRVLAYGLLHYGWLHLITNALGLAVLGPLVARLYGGLGFALVFTLGVGLGGLGISILGSHGLTVGASAGVMALMGALVVGCRLHRGLRSSRTGRSVGRLLLVLMILQTLLDAVTPMVSSVGHGVGAVVGLGCGGLFLALSQRSERAAGPRPPTR